MKDFDVLPRDAPALYSDEIRAKRYSLRNRSYESTRASKNSSPLGIGVEDIAIAFIESSRSILPALTSKANTKGSEPAESARSAFSLDDDDKDKEKERPINSDLSWAACRKWMDTERACTDDIAAGLNYAQFVDCIGVSCPYSNLITFSFFSRHNSFLLHVFSFVYN